jgi:hypothetical protein
MQRRIREVIFNLEDDEERKEESVQMMFDVGSHKKCSSDVG